MLLLLPPKTLVILLKSIKCQRHGNMHAVAGTRRFEVSNVFVLKKLPLRKAVLFRGVGGGNHTLKTEKPAEQNTPFPPQPLKL